MAGTFFSRLAPGWQVVTAGTHVVEGQPMSRRTRDALSELGYQAPNHRSSQFGAAEAKSMLIVAFEPSHIGFVRREHPEAANRAATIGNLVRDLSPGPDPIEERLAALRLADVGIEEQEEVIDPAGGDMPQVRACAAEVLELTTRLARTLSSDGSTDAA